MNNITLNKNQKLAVEHHGSPLLIIAGAGTGKTTVITERIKRLIEKGLEPSEILALTFTQKAAQEMEERVDVALPLGYAQTWISTFHSFCERILRNEASQIGLNPDFKLLTEAESVLLLKQNIYNLKLDYFRPRGNPEKFLDGLVSHFSRLQDEDITPKQYLAFAQKISKSSDTKDEKFDSKQIFELAKAYIEYQEIKEKNSFMDFADLISNTLELFRKRPNILKNYKDKFKHILVDEFQDTNIAQYELIKLLSPPAKNTSLTITGDDSQSVYKFRGAAVSNILNFIDDYSSAKMIVLDQNYRSQQAILDHAYLLIKNNDPDTLEAKMGINKNLVSMREISSNPINIVFSERVEDEASQVAQKIEQLHKNKKYDYNDFAILVRANNHSEPFARALGRAGIPYQFLGPGHLFNQPEIKDLIAYLKVLDSPVDDVALFRVLCMSHFDFSLRDLIFIKNFATRNNLSIFEALEEINKKAVEYKLPRISKKTEKKISKFIKMVYKHIDLIPDQTGGQILYYFLQDSKLLKKHLSPKTEKEEKAALNISKFFDRVKSFENSNSEAGVSQLNAWIELKMEMGESPLASETDWSQNNAVNILTVHSSKGLEFPIVFMVNLVNQRFPTNRRSEQIPISQALIKEILPLGDPHLQEERRLFYVGMTRAKDYLYLTGARFYGDAKMAKKLSGFVYEAMGEKEVQKALNKINTSKNQLSFLDWEKIEQPEAKIINQPVSTISFSRIDTFETCPLQYHYRYNLRIPAQDSPALIMGDAVHKTLKEFYQNQLSAAKKLTFPDLFKIFESNWHREGFATKKHALESKNQVKKMLKKFYGQGFEYNKIGQVMALEQPFNIKITSGLSIRGVIDRIDNIKKDLVEVIDYKTGSRVPSQKEVDNNLQLTIYALAINSLRGFSFSRPAEKIFLSLYYLEEGVKISTQRTQDQLVLAKKLVIEMAEKMEKEKLLPKPNRPYPCDFCEFRLLCDAYK